jgi:hypothetical protein
MKKILNILWNVLHLWKAYLDKQTPFLPPSFPSTKAKRKIHNQAKITSDVRQPHEKNAKTKSL